jgi:hypothetical protein
MGLKRNPLNYWLGLLVPLIVPIASETAIATASASATTFSSAFANIYLHDFSHDPFFVIADAQGETTQFSRGGSVAMTTAGNALFVLPPEVPKTYATNFSRAEGTGTGLNYFGTALSTAGVVGQQFSIKAGQTFGFNFGAQIDNIVNVDRPGAEQAIADSRVTFAVLNSETNEVLDTLSFAGSLNAAHKQEQRLFTSSSTQFWSANQSYDNLIGLNGYRQYTTWWGNYSRKFEEDTLLTLVEVKQNYAFVKAPEPGAIAGLLLVTTVGIRYSRRRKSLNA